MTRPCMNCGVGAHPTQVCIKSKNSTIGAPALAVTTQQSSGPQQYTKWSDGRDTNKRVEEAQDFKSYS